MSQNRRNTAISFVSWNAVHPIPAVLALCLIPGALLSALPLAAQQWAGWGMAICAALLAIVWTVLTVRRKLPRWGHGGLWWGIGFCLRFGFILRMPYYKMQHDVLDFTENRGHAGYILYLLHEGHLPDFDVREVWQFYHPPLHHTLCALWMRLLGALGMPEVQVFESVQVLPFTYSCLLLAVFGLLLRHFELKGAAFAVPFALMAAHPSQIILSGSINNDMLSILFLGASLLLSLCWFREQKLSTILGLALTIGLGMFTKLSAWMAAPAAAFLFLLRFLWEKDHRKQLFGQYICFGLVCVPLGLFWSVRNYLSWQVPPQYIPMISKDSGQYVGDHSVLERLLDFSPHQFAYIYDCYTIYGQDYSEYNPLIGLLKTAVFDEFVNTDRYPCVRGFGNVLFWSQVLLAGIALAAMLITLRRKGMLPEKVALLLTYGVTVLSYFAFCLTYPHTCTQSFRYAVPALYTSLLFLGLWLGSTKPPRWFRYLLTGTSAVFLGTSAAVYGVLLYL